MAKAVGAGEVGGSHRRWIVCILQPIQTSKQLSATGSTQPEVGIFIGRDCRVSDLWSPARL